MNRPRIRGTARYQLGIVLRLDEELQDSWNVGIPKMDLDTKETHETHNFYIESIRGSFKNIIQENINCEALEEL